MAGDGEPACKRDSVGRLHDPVAIHLCGLPGDVDRAGHLLLGLAPSGGYRAVRVTSNAGALLPHRFTLTCAARERTAIGGLLSAALNRQVTPSWLSPALCPLESRLSSTPSRPKTTGAAATQPAHRRHHGTGQDQGVSLKDASTGPYWRTEMRVIDAGAT